MDSLEISSMLADAKRYIRDMKFSIIFGNGAIEIVNDLESLSGKVPMLFGRSTQKKRNEYVRQMKELGGVLTGSAALSMYRINGKKIFYRTPKDLDFIVSRDAFIKFCGMNSFGNVKYSNKVVSIDFHTGKDRGTDSYGYHRGYRFYTDFDVIGTDEETGYETVGDLKVAKLMDVISYKVYLVEKYLNGQSHMNRDDRSAAEKHVRDLFMIVTSMAANEGKKA
jgi:hypothetical protein